MDLKKFSREFGEEFFDEDVDAILRRVDTNDDDRIDYNEFI